MKASLIQLDSGAGREANLAAIEASLRVAAQRGSGLAVLPEACAYRGRFTPEQVESEDGPSIKRIAALASELAMPVVIGGIWTPSADPERPYNTSIVIDAAGRAVARYRKVHLFRLDSEDGAGEDEATHTTPGDEAVVVRVAGLTLGLGICYDLRFAGFYRALARAGATVLLAPSNFAAYTGRAHWDVLTRARAIENLAFVLAPAQAGVDETGFAAYGHTIAVDPWGSVLARADEMPTVLTVDLDPAAVAAGRRELRSLEHDRRDVYDSPPRIEDADD